MDKFVEKCGLKGSIIFIVLFGMAELFLSSFGTALIVCESLIIALLILYLESYIKTIQGEMNENLKIENRIINDKLVEMQNNTLVYLSELKENQKELKADIGIVSTSILNTVVDLREKIAEQHQENMQTMSGLASSQDGIKADIAKAMEEVQKFNIAMTGRIDSAEGRIKADVCDIAEEIKQVDTDLNSRIDSIDEGVLKLNALVDDVNTKLIEQYQESMQAMNNLANSQDNIRADVYGVVKDVRQTNADLKGRMDSLDKELYGLNAGLVDINEKMAVANVALSKLSGVNVEELLELKRTLASAQESMSTLTISLGDMNGMLAEMQQENVQSLNSIKEDQNSMKNGIAAVAEIMEHNFAVVDEAVSDIGDMLIEKDKDLEYFDKSIEKVKEFVNGNLRTEVIRDSQNKSLVINTLKDDLLIYSEMRDDNKLTFMAFYNNGKIAFSKSFDLDGNITSEIEYHPDGQVKERKLYLVENGRVKVLKENF